jgi:hypothetical protein
MENNDSLKKKIPVQEDGIDDLEKYIEKKKIQNEVLKKIMDKLNSPEKHKNNK